MKCIESTGTVSRVVTWLVDHLWQRDPDHLSGLRAAPPQFRICIPDILHAYFIKPGNGIEGFTAFHLMIGKSLFIVCRFRLALPPPLPESAGAARSSGSPVRPRDWPSSNASSVIPYILEQSCKWFHLHLDLVGAPSFQFRILFRCIDLLLKGGFHRDFQCLPNLYPRDHSWILHGNLLLGYIVGFGMA